MRHAQRSDVEKLEEAYRLLNELLREWRLFAMVSPQTATEAAAALPINYSQSSRGVRQ